MNRKFIRKDIKTRNLFTFKNIVIFAAVFFSLLILFFYANINLRSGRIDCVNLSGGNCDQALSSRLKSFEGKPFFKSIRSVKQVLKENPAVQKFSIRYLPPDNLIISIVQSDALFALTDNKGDFFETINNDGVVTSIVDHTDLPKLVTDDKVDVGKNVPDGTLFALLLLKDLNKTFMIESAVLSDGSMTVEIKPATKVVFPLSGDRQVLIGSLVLIYDDLNNQNGSKLNTKGKKIDTIDLRFKNPVLK